jgi:hypothetical protein
VIPQQPTKVDRSSVARLALPTYNDVVRILSTGTDYLARLVVGVPLVAKNNDPIARGLRWGALNRAIVGFNMNASLPAIESAWVGVPLYFAKCDGGGSTTVTITPTGWALDRRTKPKINNAASFVASDARLYLFVSDGTNWFTDGV